MAKSTHLTIDGKSIAFSNLGKRLFPSGYTKGQAIDFYVRAAEAILPHLRGRPVTLKRYPNGVRGEVFYEKDAPSFTPDWVKTFPVPRHAGGPDIRYIVIDNLATLAWTANLANLELHPFLHRAPKIERPTHVVFDLDPGEGADVLTCAAVAFRLKSLLEELKLQSFVKVSGSRGLQIHVPLNAPLTYRNTQPFAQALAQVLSRQHPDLIVSEMPKYLRRGKVFVDWSQNSDYKTTVGVYSLRAKRERPFVSLPVTWEELKRALDKSKAEALYFEPDAALKRLEAQGDLFAPVLTMRQSLPPEFMRRVPPQAAALDRAAKTTSVSATRTPRRSAQGSRRRFVVEKRGTVFELRLEMQRALRCWRLRNDLRRTATPIRALQTMDRPIADLDRLPLRSNRTSIWDVGTYELIEGAFFKGILRLAFEGQKLKGEWLIRRQQQTKHAWDLTRITGSGRARPLRTRSGGSSPTTTRRRKAA